jgi:hypothetical protein
MSISKGSSQTAISEGNLNSAAKMLFNMSGSKNDQTESNSSNEQVTSLKTYFCSFWLLS